MTPHISLDLAVWFRNFERELDALLSDIFQLCAAAKADRYADGTVNQAGVMSVVLPAPDLLGAGAPERAARNAFIGGMSKFNGFIDRLIATRIVKSNQIPVTRTLSGEEEILAYVRDYLDGMIAEVARDPSLNVPKKLDSFTGVDPAIKGIALEYNALRNALEHHHDIPKREIRTIVRKIAAVVEEREITELPMLVKEGDRLGIAVLTEEKIYPANQKILLQPQDSYELLFTLRFVIARSIFNWHMSSVKPSQLQP